MAADDHGIRCPACKEVIDVDEEDIDEGDTISCDECGANLKVVGTEPLELESADDLEEEEEEDDDFLEDEDEEEGDEDWR
jgi:alpha-aminoadipate carrier protein LysW